MLLHQSPDDLVIDATEFLNQVAQNADNSASDQIDAVKALAKREVPTTRAREGTSAEADANREKWRTYFIRTRRVRLMEAGLWPAPPGWADDLESDDFVAPQENFGEVSLEGDGLSQSAPEEKNEARGNYSIGRRPFAFGAMTLIGARPEPQPFEPSRYRHRIAERWPEPQDRFGAQLRLRLRPLSVADRVACPVPGPDQARKLSWL